VYRRDVPYNTQDDPAWTTRQKNRIAVQIGDSG
jgi:hypothetical protein